jgi:hypothetical protein
MLVQLCVSYTASFLLVNIKSYGGGFPSVLIFLKKMDRASPLKKRIVKQHNSHSKSLAICAIWLIFFRSSMLSELYVKMNRTLRNISQNLLAISKKGDNEGGKHHSETENTC